MGLLILIFGAYVSANRPFSKKPSLFERAWEKNSLILGNTAYWVAVVAIVVILGVNPCTIDVHVVHIRRAIVIRWPEVAVDTLPPSGTAVVVPGDWRRDWVAATSARYNNRRRFYRCGLFARFAFMRLFWHLGAKRLSYSTFRQSTHLVLPCQSAGPIR